MGKLEFVIIGLGALAAVAWVLIPKFGKEPDSETHARIPVVRAYTCDGPVVMGLADPSRYGSSSGSGSKEKAVIPGSNVIASAEEVAELIATADAYASGKSYTRKSGSFIVSRVSLSGLGKTSGGGSF